MRYACPYCGRVHDKRNACGLAPTRHESDTEQRRLRNRQAWKKVKRLANERDGYLCVMCLAEGTITYGGLETHHIVPLAVAPELAYDIDNLATLCKRHHEAAEKDPPDSPTEFWESLRNHGTPSACNLFRKPGV